MLTVFAEELAKKTGVSNTQEIVKRIRWEVNQAGAILIMKKGAKVKGVSNLLATISPKQGNWTHLYPSWQKALADLDEKKRIANVSRISHDGINTGTLPVKE